MMATVGMVMVGRESELPEGSDGSFGGAGHECSMMSS